MKYRWPLVLWMVFFSVGYLITFVHGFPVVKYYPVSHAWGLEGAYPDPGMAWFGKVAAGILAGLIGCAVGAVIAKVRGAESRPPLALDAAAWLSVFVAAAYAARYEWIKWV